MKKINIVLLVLIAAGISLIVMKFGDFSTYETFASASKEPGKKFVVMGVLDKNKGLEFDPKKDPNLMIFYAKDKDGDVTKIRYVGGYIRDIDKSEQLVLTGYIDDGVFHCSNILAKCPSKYKKNLVAQGSSS